MKTFFVTVAVMALLGLAHADEDEHGLHVKKDYGKDTFKTDIADGNHFVMFFAPWCGHCKRLHPTWEDLAVKYDDDKEVTIGAVDCTVETALCSENEVTGYPTLKFFKKGSSDAAEKYKGQRDIDALNKYIQKQLGNEPEEEAVLEPEIAVADKGLYVLGQKSFAAHIKEGNHFVKFYAPWCGHCQKLAPIWDELAEEFADSKDAKIAKLDCTQAQSVCQENDVKGYPTLAFFKNGKLAEVYRGARNMKELKDYVKTMTETKDKPEADKVPSGDDDSNVVILGKTNFEDTIAKGVTFIKFYAPWCGHCKRLAPTWDELAAKFAGKSGVTIAKVDCTSAEDENKDLCNEQGVNGFPTLNIYKDGKKAAEYSGKRDLSELEAFVGKHYTGKDEL